MGGGNERPRGRQRLRDDDGFYRSQRSPALDTLHRAVDDSPDRMAISTAASTPRLSHSGFCGRSSSSLSGKWQTTQTVPSYPKNPMSVAELNICFAYKSILLL